MDGRATQVAAWSLPWLRSCWQSCHRRANLGCQAACAGPTGGARRVPVGRLAVVAIEGCPNAFRAVRPFPLSVASGWPWRAGGSGRTRRGERCPDGCPIVASIVDAGHDRADSGTEPGLRTFCIEHGYRWPRRTAPDAGSGTMRITVLSGQGQDVQAAWLAVAGWSGAWPDAGCWEVPPLGRRRPDQVQTHRRGGHLELGMSGRPDA